MGNTASAPAPSLDQLEDEEQRVLLRNVSLLNGRNTANPGKFVFADFREVHAAMPPRLAAALWRALSASAGAEVVDLEAVVRVVVPLRLGQTSVPSAAALAHAKACFVGEPAASASTVALEEAAPWLKSVGRPVGAAALAHDEGAIARLLADAACAAWLTDLLEPLPMLSEGATRLLTSEHVRFLSRALPAEQRREWRLLFTTARDGVSFTRFVALGSKRAPCILILRDSNGAIFGGYAAEPLAVAPRFGGGYGSFVFSLATPAYPAPSALHRASGQSPNLVYLNANMEQLPNGLAFGGNLDATFFGLWLRDDLETGRSDGPCATYSNSPCLASAAEFKVDELELWAVADDPPPPSEEEAAAAAGENALTAAGVLSSKHEETRNFLAMAGRAPQHSASLAPAP